MTGKGAPAIFSRSSLEGKPLFYFRLLWLAVHGNLVKEMGGFAVFRSDHA